MIEHIEFNGEEYPFLLGWSAYKEYVKLSDKGDVDPLDFYDKGIHLGFVYGAKKEGKKPFSLEKMLDMFDDDADFQDKVTDVFFKHLGRQKKIQDKMMGGINQLSK